MFLMFFFFQFHILGRTGIFRVDTSDSFLRFQSSSLRGCGGGVGGWGRSRGKTKTQYILFKNEIKRDTFNSSLNC